MPKRKAILLPDWLTAAMRGDRVEGSIYRYTPAYMHWKPLELIIHAVNATAKPVPIAKQFEDTLQDIVSKYQASSNSYSLVACLEFPKNIPFTVILTIADNVAKPATTHHIVLRLWRNGHVKDVERVYSLECNQRK